MPGVTCCWPRWQVLTLTRLNQVFPARAAAA
jgi:hypothetical protein